MPFQITPQHADIFEAIRFAKENIIIEAVAGAGKTSTICEGLRCIPASDSLVPPAVSFLTFSRPSADALASRLPRHVQATTFNALGHRALGRLFPDSRRRKDWLDSRKCAKILWDLGERENPDFQNVLRLVGLMKSVPPESTPPNLRVLSFVAQHGFILEDERAAQQMCCEVLRKSNSLVEKSIDFNDQLYLPVLLDAEFDEQDFVFVDECQDTNEIQLEILERIANCNSFSNIQQISKDWKPSPSPTFFCFVGDPWQAIYGFRGANTDSMERIAKRFSCRPFPLSVSYRCPKAIVREAQKYMKD